MDEIIELLLSHKTFAILAMAPLLIYSALLSCSHHGGRCDGGGAASATAAASAASASAASAAVVSAASVAAAAGKLS